MFSRAPSRCLHQLACTVHAIAIGTAYFVLFAVAAWHVLLHGRSQRRLHIVFASAVGFCSIARSLLTFLELDPTFLALPSVWTQFLDGLASLGLYLAALYVLFFYAKLAAILREERKALQKLSGAFRLCCAGVVGLFCACQIWFVAARSSVRMQATVLGVIVLPLVSLAVVVAFTVLERVISARLAAEQAPPSVQAQVRRVRLVAVLTNVAFGLRVIGLPALSLYWGFANPLNWTIYFAADALYCLAVEIIPSLMCLLALRSAVSPESLQQERAPLLAAPSTNA